MSYPYDLYIDPGHGGTDSGASGHGAKEKDWTLKISLYQYRRLKELGVKVAITRTTDKTLDSTPRTNLIKNKARYCMSNHFNAFNGSARGVEVIHSVWTDDKLAKRFADAICEVSKLPFRRVFSKQADWTTQKLDWYYMQRLTGNTITITVEYGFIDNKADNDYYKNEDNFYKVAERVVKEWCAILGKKYVAPKTQEKPKPKPNPKPKEEDDMLNKAIVINSFADFPVAEPVANRLSAPIYLRSAAEKKEVAKEIIVIGGTKAKIKGKVSLLAGKDRYETAAAVKKYLSK